MRRSETSARQPGGAVALSTGTAGPPLATPGSSATSALGATATSGAATGATERDPFYRDDLWAAAFADAHPDCGATEEDVREFLGLMRAGQFNGEDIEALMRTAWLNGASSTYPPSRSGTRVTGMRMLDRVEPSGLPSILWAVAEGQCGLGELARVNGFLRQILYGGGGQRGPTATGGELPPLPELPAAVRRHPERRNRELAMYFERHPRCTAHRDEVERFLDLIDAEGLTSDDVYALVRTVDISNRDPSALGSRSWRPGGLSVSERVGGGNEAGRLGEAKRSLLSAILDRHCEDMGEVLRRAIAILHPEGVALRGRRPLRIAPVTARGAAVRLTPVSAPRGVTAGRIGLGVSRVGAPSGAPTPTQVHYVSEGEEEEEEEEGEEKEREGERPGRTEEGEEPYYYYAEQVEEFTEGWADTIMGLLAAPNWERTARGDDEESVRELARAGLSEGTGWCRTITNVRNDYTANVISYVAEAMAAGELPDALREDWDVRKGALSRELLRAPRPPPPQRNSDDLSEQLKAIGVSMFLPPDGWSNGGVDAEPGPLTLGTTGAKVGDAGWRRVGMRCSTGQALRSDAERPIVHAFVYIALRWVLDGGHPPDAEALIADASKITRSAIKQRLAALRNKEAGWAAEQRRVRRTRVEGVEAKRKVLRRRRRGANPGGE